MIEERNYSRKGRLLFTTIAIAVDTFWVRSIDSAFLNVFGDSDKRLWQSALELR